MKTTLLLCCVLLITACSDAPPNECVTREELLAEFQAAYEAGDMPRMMALTYTEGSPEEHLDFWRMVYGMGAGKVKVWKSDALAAEDHISQLTDGQLPWDKPVTLLFEPTHWIVLKAKRSTGQQGAFRTTLELPAGEKDGKWWIVSSRFATPEEAEQQRLEREAKQLPLGVELSKTKGISLKRVEEHLGSRFGSNDDWTTIAVLDAKGSPLSNILMEFDIEGRWHKGLQHLPEGFFSLSVEGLPMARDVLFNLFRKTCEESFGLTITVEDHEWDAYHLTPPNPLPKAFKPDTNTESQRWGTSGLGYEINQHTFAQFAEWLESEGDMGRPVIIENAPAGTFTFEIECDVFDKHDSIMAWLEDTGFTIRTAKVSRPSVVIEKTARPNESKQ